MNRAAARLKAITMPTPKAGAMLEHALTAYLLLKTPSNRMST